MKAVGVLVAMKAATADRVLRAYNPTKLAVDSAAVVVVLAAVAAAAAFVVVLAAAAVVAASVAVAAAAAVAASVAVVPVAAAATVIKMAKAAAVAGPHGAMTAGVVAMIEEVADAPPAIGTLATTRIGQRIKSAGPKVFKWGAISPLLFALRAMCLYRGHETHRSV